MGPVWKKCSGQSIPDDAFRAGYDKDGHALYVARAKMEDGVMTPGKVGFNLPCAHISFDGKVIKVQDYEILVFPVRDKGFYGWQRFKGGDVPQNAVSTDKGMYVARYFHDDTDSPDLCDSLIPGKVHTDHHCMYVAYEEKELKFDKYEVLYCRKPIVNV